MFVVFVTTELHPVLPGAVGTVVAEVGMRLVEAGHRVEVMVVGHPPAGEAGAGALPVTWVEPGTPDLRAPDQHQAAARSAAEALAGLAEQPDLVEFQDPGGLGYWALLRRGELGLERTPMMVRVHGTVDPGAGRQQVPASLQQEALRMADAVVASTGTVAQLLARRIGIEPERVRIGQPPVPAFTKVPRRPAPAPEIVGYGRFDQEEGWEDLLRAIFPLLEADREATLRLVAADGSGAEAHLQSLVPEGLGDRVRFEGLVKRHDLGEALASAWMAVFPDRAGSFCLAAHECRALGLPVVVPQQGEFMTFFGYRTGALVYDGTGADLRLSLSELIARPDMRLAMSEAPLPVYGDPLAPYRPLVPRHPRTQAGLGTAALRRVEAVRPPADQVGRAVPSLTSRLLDRLPESAASRLESGPVTLRAMGTWRRRRAAGAWERWFMEESWNGDYPELEDPAVSIVIPCFNQGAFLHDAIRSVFRQAFPSWEIVVVDDGSTDSRTRAVLAALHYPRTRIIRQRNQGLPAARNAGMRAARGRYLVPLDADDELGPAFLTATTDALERHPRAAFAHTWTRLFGNQNLVWIDRPYNPYQVLLSTSIVGCALIRADAWRQVGGYDTSRRRGNEDWDLWVRFIEHGWSQIEVPHPLFRYRQHGISMSVTTEARFEDARREMAESHPALYGREALRALKAEWYPWVSVLVDAATDPARLAGQTLDDLEVVVIGPAAGAIEELCGRRGWPLRPAGPSLASAVHSARGKFFIDWRPVTAAGTELLEELASRLEDDVDAYASAVEPGRHPTLWRRWSLLDPDAGPDRLAKAGTSGSGPALTGSEYLGAFPHPRWAIDPGRFDRPVNRVRPETEGRFPEWLP